MTNGEGDEEEPDEGVPPELVPGIAAIQKQIAETLERALGQVKPFEKLEFPQLKGLQNITIVSEELSKSWSKATINISSSALAPLLNQIDAFGEEWRRQNAEMVNLLTATARVSASGTLAADAVVIPADEAGEPGQMLTLADAYDALLALLVGYVATMFVLLVLNGDLEDLHKESLPWAINLIQLVRAQKAKLSG